MRSISPAILVSSINHTSSSQNANNLACPSFSLDSRADLTLTTSPGNIFQLFTTHKVTDLFLNLAVTHSPTVVCPSMCRRQLPNFGRISHLTGRWQTSPRSPRTASLFAVPNNLMSCANVERRLSNPLAMSLTCATKNSGSKTNN